MVKERKGKELLNYRRPYAAVHPCYSRGLPFEMNKPVSDDDLHPQPPKTASRPANIQSTLD